MGRVAVVATVTRIPSLEPALDAIATALRSDWSAAAADVDAQSPTADAHLIAPRSIIYANADGYWPLLRQWPSVVLIAHNLRRVDSPDSLAGVWRGAVEAHCWLVDQDAERLVRSLWRYAATVWLVLTSADEARALGGARLCPETFAINRYPDAGQSQAQQAIGLSVEMVVRA